MAKVKQLSKIALLFLVLCLLPNSAGAFDLAVNSISPSTEEVTTELPPLPPRLTGLGWNGVPNTTYTISLSVSEEPALLVGVGAKILTSQYTSGTLVVTALYEGNPILTNNDAVLPDNSFLIVVDPGVATTSPLKKRAVRKNPRIQVTDTSSPPCYGPASDLSIFKDAGGDFGDDDGLLDPPSPSDADTSLGLPQNAPGSFISTLSFFWCITPSTEGNADFGFKSLGPQGALDEVEITLSDDYLNFLSAQVGESLNSFRLALFNGGVQVSIDVSDLNGGVQSKVQLPFIDGSTEFSGTASPDAPSTSDKLITRQFTFGLREKLSLAPENFKPSTPEISLFGFVGEPELIGELVEVVRFDPRQRDKFRTQNFVSIKASQGIVIAREVVQSNGSYSAQVPSSAVFPNNAKNATLGARIPAEQIQQSRQVSLTNKARNQRR